MTNRKREMKNPYRDEEFRQINIFFNSKIKHDILR